MCTSDELDSFHSIPENCTRDFVVSSTTTKKLPHDRNDYLTLLALNFSALTFHRRIGGDA
jgi:hypothetical protein